ncbi:acyl transferase domain-containing protein [Streptomyces umbrinus]|uniref:Acyl transferase domain-containing protein n=1 Tax=Streptomyces umbrinus TaxID=67370 RepID=A0ABU0SXM5_9ACTN|nr:beta-ketoacyl synthase N-terminal-like domain-containing protein [Streptomyces umbrinus]MDQ1028295.1 acyl transferase domain-containing protein [Streptomyces umbrinus]
MQDPRVAVIGMALRFPGADTPEEYWHDIRSGVSHVRPFTDSEFAAAGLPEELYRAPDFTGASALLHGVDGFDAGFFGMSGREATLTDPQQRLFLECAHHALEDGGYAGRGGSGRSGSVRIGVYASVGYRLYSLHSYLASNIGESSRADDWTTVKQIQVGNYPDFTANRAAFRLGLDGPAVNVATACSSGLVSVHLACQALLAGDVDLMVVGSAALHLPQVTGHRHVKGSTISRSGAVRAFDAAADGTVGGNGVAAVLLKPLANALADGDTVHAVILGSAVTNDGADKAGFAAPGVAGQRDAVLGALDRAGVGAGTIGYLEAHGTGTYKGDPIEFAALSEAFRRHTDRKGFCALGSTKPAIGHLDSAAGLAGLVKAVLVLRHGVVPPLVNLTRPNPRLGLDESPFTLPRRAMPWPLPGDGPRRAGVHSIGMGGTNAHVILEEAPAVPGRTVGATVPALLPLSAHSPKALEEYARSFRDALVRRPDTAPADLLTTAALGRRHLRHRLVVTAPDVTPAAVSTPVDDPADNLVGRLVRGLDAFLADPGRPAPPTAAYHTGTVDTPAPIPVTPAYVFSGQGGGRPGMAAALAGRFPVVADVLERCARIHQEETGEPDFLDRIVGGEGPERWGTDFAQPALFALQVAQARLWQAFGVRPSAVAGHSVGEYAALCVAGALSPEDGMRLVCRRGRLMQDTEPGAMLAVFAPPDRVRRLLGDIDETRYGRLELAVSNGPAYHVVAGPPAAVEAARAWLAEHEVAGEPLPVDRAFHTALLDPVLDELRAAVGKAELRPVQVEFVSGLDGTAYPVGWLPDADHLVRQARHTADFHAVLRTLAPRGALVELGPGAPLTGMARRAVPETLCVPTQGPGADTDGLWTAAARLHCAGVDLDWAALLDGCGGRRIPLPVYPFQHRSYWTGPPPHPGPAVGRLPAKEGSVEDGMTEQAVLERVRELTARHLGYRADELGAGQTFVGLGADSLQLIGLLRQLENEFGVRTSVREVLEEAGTPELTARLIAARAGRPASEPEGGHPVQIGTGPAAEPASAAPASTPAAAPASGPASASALAAGPAPAPAPMPAAAPAAATDPAPVGPAPMGPDHALRAEVAELRRQIDLLAETQAAMLTQLSEAIALLGAERVR